MSDQQLADSFHQKYYADLPKEEFYKKIGVSENIQGRDFKNQDINSGGIAPGLLGLPQPETPRTLGGELTNAALALPGVNVARFIPQAGRLAKGLANAGGLIGQNAAIGGVANALDNESVGGGIVHGAGLGATMAALPYAIPAAKKIFNTGKSIVGDIKNVLTESKATPKLTEIPKYEEFPEFGGIAPPKEHVSTAKPEAKALIEKLGGGAKTKEESTKKLASQIMEGFGGRAEQAGQFFEHPLQQVGKNERLYEFTDPLITTRLDKEKDMINKLKDLKVGQLFDEFKKKPTFHNAHELQSEIGAAIGDLKNNLSKTADDRATIAKLRSVRNQLKTDIMDFLKRRDLKSNENLAPMYQRGIDFYREHVEPYLSSRKLREITRGGAEVPKNIEKIFESPSTIKNPRTGEIKQAPQHKILEDLPQEAKDLILFNKIGASKYANKPNKLVEALMNAENTGFQSYFNPELKEAMKVVAQKHESDIAAKQAQKLAHKIAEREAKNAHKAQARKHKTEYKENVREIKEKNKAELYKKEEALRKLNIYKGRAATTLLGGTGGAGAVYFGSKLFGGT